MFHEQIDWTTFVNAGFKLINEKLHPSEEIVVYAPEYLKKISEFLKTKAATQQGNMYALRQNFIDYMD